MICLVSEAQVVDWEDILIRFSSHQGTIREFCKENNITAHQLYYQRKRKKALQNNGTHTFHAIRFTDNSSSKDAIEETATPNLSTSSSIKIEIGKAKIYVPGNDKISLSNIFRMIIESC